MTQVRKFTEKELQQHKPLPGEVIVLTTEEGQTIGSYIYNNDTWTLLKANAEGGLSLSLYDINKQIIAQLPVIENLNEAHKALASFCCAEKNTYYMLYSKELSYFTLFKMFCKNPDCLNLMTGITECIHNIRSFDYNEESHAIEIWGEVGNELSCFYLFPYDSGLVTIGG